MSAISIALAWIRFAKIPHDPSPTHVLKTQIACLRDSLRRTLTVVFATQFSHAKSPGNIRSRDRSSQSSPGAAGAAAIQDQALGMSGTVRELRRSEKEGHPGPEPLSKRAREAGL